MSAYTEKFKDPRWQKKRLEILERNGWMCQGCGEKEKTLNVHHKWYEKGLDPWEYEDQCLATLCETCHDKFHKNKNILDKILSKLTNFKDLVRIGTYAQCVINDDIAVDDVLNFDSAMVGLRDFSRMTDSVFLDFINSQQKHNRVNLNYITERRS